VKKFSGGLGERKAGEVQERREKEGG